MEERGEITSGQKILLKQALHKKVDYYLKKPSIDAVQVYNLMKDFFKAFFSSETEFTREEILHELDKVYLEDEVKAQLEELVRILGRVEFSHPKYADEELREYLKEFAGLAEILVHAETVTIGFWDKLTKKLALKFRKNPEKKPEDEKLTPFESFLLEADKEYAPGTPSDDFRYKKQKTVHHPIMKTKDEGPPLFKPSAPSNNSDDSMQEPVETVRNEPAPAEEVQEDEEPQYDIHFTSNPDDYIEGHPETEDDIILANFNELLQRFYASIAVKDNDLALKLYGELRHAYENLKPEEKKKYYDHLLSAYEEVSDS